MKNFTMYTVFYLVYENERDGHMRCLTLHSATLY
jgi:hypothetical protein